jgi:hypothetical protein
MQFDGQVWFSFTDPDVWIFYRFVRAVASCGNDVNLEWVPLPHAEQESAMSTFLAISDVQQRARFLHAMLGLIHLERVEFDDDSIVGRASDAAEIGAIDGSSGGAELASLAASAASLGVVAAPTLYRHGPASHIRLTEAVLTGDVTLTANSIWAIAGDDGVWEISKP